MDGWNTNVLFGPGLFSGDMLVSGSVSQPDPMSGSGWVANLERSNGISGLSLLLQRPSSTNSASAEGGIGYLLLGHQCSNKLNMMVPYR